MEVNECKYTRIMLSTQGRSYHWTGGIAPQIFFFFKILLLLYVYVLILVILFYKITFFFLKQYH